MTVENALPSRYEIRVLEPEYLKWASAIITHSNLFHSPVWPVLYPENLTKRAYDLIDCLDYMVNHQIASGLSLGVFDKEYKFKREESAATGGKLYWDHSDESADAAKLLEQMDFPLVSVALAYDSFNGYDMVKLSAIFPILPAFAPTFHLLGTKDQREPSSWQAKAPGEVAFRNATATRRDYEGRGIMKATAQYMMRDMAAKGYRGIQIEAFSDAVHHVWSKPPAPFKADVISEIDMWTEEEVNEKGEVVYPFRPGKQRLTKIYCTLK